LATAILDLDVERLPEAIEGLDRYATALALLRLQGTPCGQLRRPVVDGRVDVAQLRDEVIAAFGWSLARRRLQRQLGWEAPPSAAAGGLPSVTVAVCTRDRPLALAHCLEALERLPDDGQELLVIDNCPSRPDSRHVVARHPRVRYVVEPRLGLDCARNRALQEARHDVVAFADDDTAPDPGWLRGLRPNFADPLVMCVTGLTMPLELETDAQEWFERYSPFGRGFERLVLDSSNVGPAHANRAGAGANMAIRRTALTAVGPFDEALDAGTPTRSGGDTDYFMRLLAAGYRIVYDPAALSWHRHRQTWADLRSAQYGYGVGVYAAWTRNLIVEGELGVLKAALGWLRYVQLPTLLRSLLRRSGRTPLDLLLAELRGCAMGPVAYLRTRASLHGRASSAV